MEGDTARPASAAPAPAIAACASTQSRRLRKYHLRNVRRLRKYRRQSRRPGAPWALLLAAGFVVAALVLVGLWRRDCHPLGAAARFSAIIAAGRSDACRAVRAIHRSGGRGGDRTTAGRQHRRQRHSKHRRQQSLAQAQHRAAGCRATEPHRRRHASRRSASRSSPVAAKDRARSRDAGAEHRAAQGEPAANGQRQFKSHWRAQGQPGRDETYAREGFRADPAQGVDRLPRSRLRSCAGPSGRISRRRRERGRDITRGKMDLRRLVAAEAAIVEIPFLQQRSARSECGAHLRDAIEKTRLA